MAGENDQMLQLDFGVDDGDDEGGEIVVALGGEDGAKIVKEGDDKTKTPPAGDDPVESLKSQFATMSQRAQAAEQRAVEAEQSAQQATQRVQHLETAVVGSQLDTVMSGIAAADAEAAQAEQEYTAAFEAGDGLAMARAQRKMAGAEARKLRLSEAKDDLEEQAQRRPAPQQPTRQQPAQARQPADPVEAFIQNQGIPARSAAFIRRNPKMATDPVTYKRALAAHNLADADGVEIESDEYFRRIEEAISVTKKADVQSEPQPQRRPAAPAASAAGSGGGSQLNGGGTEVRLTKREATAATDGTLVWNWDDPGGKFKKGDPIGLAEMARRKHYGTKAGLYDRSFTDQ